MFEFTKMQGAGNDFIVINNMKLKIDIDRLPSIARHLCQRRISIGANALMVADFPENGGDFKMRFYNADGTIAEMCGNGARCLARYAYDEGFARESMTIETLAGNVFAQKINDSIYKIKLNNPSEIKLNLNIEIDENKYCCDYIELGKPGIPHAVIKYENLGNTDDKAIYDLGNKIRHFSGFSKGANVNFYEITEDNKIIVKTFERGVEDFTLACGTGSGSVATAIAIKNEVKRDSQIEVTVPGGKLFIDIDFIEKSNEIRSLYLSGETKIVYRGLIADEFQWKMKVNKERSLWTVNSEGNVPNGT